MKPHQRLIAFTLLSLVVSVLGCTSTRQLADLDYEPPILDPAYSEAAGPVHWLSGVLPEYPQDELFRDDHTYLEVLGRGSTTGEPIPGISLSLCPEGMTDDPWSEACEKGVTNELGRASFRDLPTGKFLLRASLEGFADTVIGPLGIGHIDPRAPRQLIVVLNPVCWDCGSEASIQDIK